MAKVFNQQAIMALAKRLCITVSALALSAACTVIRVQETDGHIKVEKHFGVVVIKPLADTSLLVSDIHGIGFVSTPMGNSFGYTNQSILTSNEDCRVVVWLEGTVSGETIDKLEKIHSICIRKTNKEEP